MNIRDNTFSFVAFFMLVCSVSLLNSCGVPYEAYIYVKNETADTLYVALEHESRYYKLDNDSGQWRHYYYIQVPQAMKASIHKALKGLNNKGGGDNLRNGMTLQVKALKGRQSSFALSGPRMCALPFTGGTPACAISPFQGFAAELADLEFNKFNIICSLV